MIALLQRVSKAEVRVQGTAVGSIGAGLLVFVCAVRGDTEQDLGYLVKKIPQLRIFEDERGKMNRSLLEGGRQLLVVPQFTLAASVRKGNRPSFEEAEVPERAKELFDAFTSRIRAEGLLVEAGVFGSKMDVLLVNDGPVTIILDSREGC